ncbi:MAG: class I SAM-dependent rRNA methyltransferase [Kiloniellaceae bacterium]
MTDEQTDPGGLPTVVLKAGCHRRVRKGHPWVYSNEVEMTPEAKALEPGALVRLATANGEPIGAATFNPHTLIAGRLLTRDPETPVDRAWFAERLGRALELRERLLGGGFYRLAHAEADGLPGLVVDRFGPALVVQANTAGMDRLWPEVAAALGEALQPEVIVLAGDPGVRALEGLGPRSGAVEGALDGPVRVEENGVVYLADVLRGQKTGWFYDQRDNRAFMARLSAGAHVLDVYCYTGGFALACARSGARAVSGLDRSTAALELAAAAAELNGLADRCTFRCADAFAELARLAGEGARFEVVIADPPAFARTRKDVGPALKGYRKLARLAARVTAPQGVLLLASCSHHVTAEAFRAEVARGIWTAGRQARVLREAGAGPDHPVHPFLPESAYLKVLVLALD